jgi:hypothetical protein
MLRGSSYYRSEALQSCRPRSAATQTEAIFKQSSEDIKTHSQLLERKFEAALEKSKDEPVSKPTRDIDLE